MKKLSTLVYYALTVAAAVAAPTANEDFVIAEDAQTFTNAVNAARDYTDAATNALNVGVTSVNAKTGDVSLSARNIGALGVAERSSFGTHLNEITNDVHFNLSNDTGRRYGFINIEDNGENKDLLLYSEGDILTRGADVFLSGWGNLKIEGNEAYPGYAQTLPQYVDSKVDGFVDAQAVTNMTALTPEYSQTPTFSEWTILRDGVDVTAQVQQPVYEEFEGYWYWQVFCVEGDNPGANEFEEPFDVNILSWGDADDGHIYIATRTRTDILGYTLGAQTNKVLPSTNAVAAVRAVADAAAVTNAQQSATLASLSPIPGQVSTLSSQVATIGAHLNAEDARFVVTNYNSETHTPEAYVEIKLPDESWSRIWSEMTRWNWLFDYYLPTNYYDKAAVNAALNDKADRAWGFYDSTTGAYAPDGYTWISSEKIAIAANLAYQRTITSEGAIWVLESNGTVTETGGMTNGFFRISDDEGNSLFEIVKGNKRTVGADASSCQIVAGFTPTKLQIGYSIVADVHPTMYVCESLETQNWKVETDSDCIANVSWSGTSGAYVAQVQGKSAYTSMFVKATYEVGGETYISNAAPVSMQYIMLNGVKYAVGTATISGNTVLTLTVAP